MLDQIKINNIKQIMLCLMVRGRATKADIVTDTGLSMSTVSSCVNSLLKLTLLVSDGMENSSGGRRSTIYSMKSDYGCFIGLDLYPDKIIAVTLDCCAQLISQKVFPISTGKKPFIALSEALNVMIAENTKVLGIGIGLCGRINSQEQVVISAPELGWDFVHLREIIERQYMVFTYVDHRVNGAAVYEGMLRRLHNVKSYLYIGEDAGEKAALVLDGRLCRGVDNTAGSLSLNDIDYFMWPSMLRFLGAADLLIGYKTDLFKESLLKKTADFDGTVHCIRQTEDAYAVGMAVAAQREWFESIYFML